MEISTKTSPTYLGSWIVPVPASDANPMFPAFAVFNGSADTLEAYAVEAARIRGLDYSDYRPEVRVARIQGALQSFARKLLADRGARYQQLLDRVAANITTAQRDLGKAIPATSEVRMAAIWGVLNSLERDAYTRGIREGVLRGDVELIQSVISAPRVFPFAPDDDAREQLQDDLLRACNAGAYDALIDLRNAAAIANSAWARCQSYIRGDAGIANEA